MYTLLLDLDRIRCVYTNNSFITEVLNAPPTPSGGEATGSDSSAVSGASS